MAAIFDIKLSGDYACFTRPEFKAERVTYLVMTPSAARGAIESIFWKPEIRWEIRRIDVMNPLKQTAILRNELSNRQGIRPIFVEDERQQRASLILQDVAYVVRAEIILQSHATDPVAKYAEQFQRRLERGQCHHTPVMGTREFPAWFEPANTAETPQALDLDLGLMLFDIAYREDRQRRELDFYRHGPDGRRAVSGYAESLFFNAKVRGGSVDVPQELYAALGVAEGHHAS
ncbi:MAG: type I-C CRISPR-associated protein Cas5c [Chloroflexi bacterium]|nr:type I-C CRISPR-associated protein Cas5c [Chloroflexota bacterium]